MVRYDNISVPVRNCYNDFKNLAEGLEKIEAINHGNADKISIQIKPSIQSLFENFKVANGQCEKEV